MKPSITAAMMYTTGGRAMAGLACVDIDEDEDVGVEDTVSFIATFRRRMPSSCKKITHE